MTMSNDAAWPDWTFRDDYEEEAEWSMRELARYANPAQVRRLGIGLGSAVLGGGQPDKENEHAAKAQRLAEDFSKQDIGYTVEAFNPHRRTGQIVRTTPELIEGAGTCLDFAISLAALCVSEDIPVILAMAILDGAKEGHAFVIVQEMSDGNADDGPAYIRATCADWRAAFNGLDPRVRHHLIDLTPPGDLEARRTRTMELLENSGTVHVVDVQKALEELAGETGEGWYPLPRTKRELGITAWLPDPPPDLEHFPSRAKVEDQLRGATGNVALVGERGTGKSTVALTLAAAASGGRGWYLDGSDRRTLLRSLAAAETQSQGDPLEDEDKDNLLTLAHQARSRLARSHRRWVVVVDNADNPNEIVDLLPNPHQEHLLIVTTTNRAWTNTLEKLESSVWHVETLELLNREQDETPWLMGLHHEELKPGLIRIARACDEKLLAAAADEPAGACRLVRAALGGRPGEPRPWPESPVATAVVTASFMPAEQITVGWLAAAAFDGDRRAAREAAVEAARRGLFEHSRYTSYERQPDEQPLWMHRLVRDAVRELIQNTANDQGLRVLATHRDERRSQCYSADEVTALGTFVLAVPEGEYPDPFPSAAAAVMDLLEPLGSQQVKTAAEIGRTVLPDLDQHVDRSRLNVLSIWCTALMACAREVNQNDDATFEQIVEADRWCATAIHGCAQAIEGYPVPANEKQYQERRDMRLLLGRAEAMRGILLKKKAKSVAQSGDRAAQRQLLREAITVLEKSYKERRTALEVTDDKSGQTKLGPDPQHHVDRGWYNLGGANIDLANVLVRDGSDTVAQTVSEALKAYVGSLSLRRYPGGTKYTAASLWGTALCLYTAALHCPGKLDLSGFEPAVELDPIRGLQTRATLLRAAELSDARALEIWAEIDGPEGKDTKKARNLFRKISLAWVVNASSQHDASSRHDILEQLRKAVRPFLQDLGEDG